MSRDDAILTDSPAAPALGASRTRVLTTLRGSAEPVAVDDVAAEVGLHPNTVRFHLDALVQAGLAARAAEDREQPGRPRMLYSTVPGDRPVGRRSYRLLAEILTGYLATHSEHPADAALEAGEAWGRFLTDRPEPFGKPDADAATEQLVGLLNDIGFAPETAGGGADRQIVLRHCPFREAAENHREVVCSVHLGLMRGMLGELRAPVKATRLEPFVGPSHCVAHLAVSSARSH